jgi:Rrf2 family nitric oxide-sensitive transcriptional repressor
VLLRLTYVKVFRNVTLYREYIFDDGRHAMRLTVRTNLAMRTLMFCAVNDGQTVQKRQIAACCNASEAHLGVVINQLSHYGFIETLRGRKGGIRLACPPEEISVGAVFRIFEAGTPFAECFSAVENQCPISGACRLRGALAKALDAFYAALDDITLTDLTRDNIPLEHLLAVGPARLSCISPA